MRSSLMKGAALTATVLGMAAMSAAPASASIGALDAVCAFTGHANVNNPVEWVGGGGAFGFVSQIAACAGQAGGKADVQPAVVINAAGNYTSLVCGTSNPVSGPASLNVAGHAIPLGGSAAGNASLDNASGHLGDASFVIPFVGGQGVIAGGFVGAGPYTGASGLVAGAVSIFPNNAVTEQVAGGQDNHPVPPPPTSNTCVDNYGVAGAFAIVG